jgi:hypothetical protein
MELIDAVRAKLDFTPRKLSSAPIKEAILAFKFSGEIPQNVINIFILKLKLKHCRLRRKAIRKPCWNTLPSRQPPI